MPNAKKTTKKKPKAKHPRSQHSRPRAGESPDAFGTQAVNAKSSLLESIQKVLAMPSTKAGKGPSRLDVAAEAYVEAMEAGSFVHLKEVLDRQEGKVPTRVGNADGTNLKGYVGIPVDGEGAP
jgi:hypothetical protein